MSGQATGWVFRNGPRDRAQRMVLLTIADAANRDGEHAHPGQEAMVEGSLYSAGHVRRTIAELISEGWVEQTEKPGPDKAAEFRIPGVAEDNAAHHARRSEEETARTTRAVTPATARERRANGAHPDARRSEEGAVSCNNNNDNAALFERFYAVYPLHKGRGAAVASFEKALKRGSFDEILAGATRYRDDPQRKPDFTAHPATWLNQDRWTDESSAPVKATTTRQEVPYDPDDPIWSRS